MLAQPSSARLAAAADALGLPQLHLMLWPCAQSSRWCSSEQYATSPHAPPLVLGRADSCDVQLDSLLFPTMVSRRHAALRADGDGAWTLDDLGAANGGFYVDRSDASITRTDGHFRRIFGAAGLRVVHCEAQRGLPRAVFPVRMYALERDV